MKYLEVEEFDPGSGSEMLASLYPRTGLHYNKRLGTLYAVNKAMGAAWMMTVPPGTAWADLLKDSPEGTVNIHKFMDQLAVLLDKKP